MNFDDTIQSQLKRFKNKTLMIMVGSVLITGAAHAESFKVNLLAFEDVHLFQSRIEGPISVLRYAEISDSLIGPNLNPSADACHVLVGGYLSFNRGSVPNGTVCVGTGSNLNEVDLLGHPQGLRADFYDEFRIARETNQWVQRLFRQGANLTVVKNEIITLAATTPNSVNLFEIPLSSLLHASEIRISAAPHAKVIIKVNAPAVSFDRIGIKLLGVTPSQVLWHFPQTERLSLSNIEFQGSILALNANMAFSDGKLHGSAIVRSAYGSGEYRYNPFIHFQHIH